MYIILFYIAFGGRTIRIPRHTTRAHGRRPLTGSDELQIFRVDYVRLWNLVLNSVQPSPPSKAKAPERSTVIQSKTQIDCELSLNLCTLDFLPVKVS